LKLIPVSRATWYAGIKDGRFPAPIKISPNIAAWKASDIHQLIEVLSSAGQE
jgi:predicted DNA-binding transcriptional regulator AlpA